MSKKETQTTKTEKGECIQIGTLFKFIKPFDGSRDKLTPFLTNCENAIDLASESQKHILLKFILSQLEGKAEIACSIKDFDSWDQLNDFLKTQFGERKHYTHLLTDLQECRQQLNESVTQFALRLETCLSKLLTEITLCNKKDNELVGRLAAMEDLALHTFLIGLKPNISNIVRCKNPLNLNEAVNTAVSEEKILQFMNRRPIAINEPSTSRPKTFYKAKNETPDFRPNFGYQNKPRTYPLFCRYCKINGHVIENCRKREYNNSKRYDFPQNKPNENRVNFVEEGEDTVDNVNECDPSFLN